MSNEITYIDLFSGLGAFPKGLIDAGFKLKNHYFSEVDKYAIANYKYNFKNAKYVGKVQEIKTDEIQRPDILTFGSPCQDLSLAGKKKDSLELEVNSFLMQLELLTGCAPKFLSLKTSKGYSSVTKERTLKSYCERLPTLGYMSANGNLLILPGYYPKIESGYFLLDLLEKSVSPEYFLSLEDMKRMQLENLE